MDADNLRKHLQQYTFRENNGKIMRTVNMLKPQESTVGNIQILMNGEPCEAVQNSLNISTLFVPCVEPLGRCQTSLI